MEDEDFDLGSDMSETYSAMQNSSGPGESAPDSPQPSQAPSSEPSPSGEAAPAPTAPEWKSLPKSWKKDYEPVWSKFDEQAQQYIHQREKEAFEGISRYKGVADKWQQTVSPYEQVFKHYEIDPHDAFRRLADAHLTLKFGSPEQKAEVGRQIIEDYGLTQFMQQAAQQPGGMPPELQAALDPLQQELRSVKQMFNQRIEKETRSEVDKFMADTQNEFAGEVMTDMIDLIKTGSASDLKSAYEKAIWLNPSVRSKLLEREAEKISKPRLPDPPNVRSSSTPPAPTGSSDDSIDDTLLATFQAIQQRH
jgi:hypothetical protein